MNSIMQHIPGTQGPQGLRAYLRHSLLLVAMVVLTACGTSAEVGTLSTNPSTGSDETTDTASITGTVVASGINASKALLLEAEENAVTIADLSDSAFATEVAAGNYSIALLDDDNQTVALLVQNGESIFTVESDTDLGDLEVDASTSVMTSSKSLSGSSATAKAATSADVDLTDLTALSIDDNDNGIDVTAILTNGVGDTDSDLVPDFLDNDNNEDGIYDNNQGLELCAGRVDLIDGEDADVADLLADVGCLVFDNLKLSATALFDGDGDALPHTDDHILAFHLTVPNALVSQIAMVEVAHMPAFADGTIENAMGGWTFASYPTVGDAWSAHSYALPHATSPDGEDQYSMWIRAASDPLPSTCIYKVTLSSGSVAYFATRLFFVFNTPAKVTVVDDGTTTTTVSYPLSSGDAGTDSNPLTIAGSGPVVLTADRPLVAAGGVEVCGMDVQAHIFYLDASGNQLNTGAEMSPKTADSGICHPAVDLALSLDLATYFPTTYGGSAVSSYQIDFTVVGQNGDNTAEIFYFSY
jgi:hypothetical protein